MSIRRAFSRPLSRQGARLGMKGLVLALALGLTGCMTATPYAPRLEGQATGYTDRALAQNRYRITFTGNSATPRETVETYLLLRSAEVARAANATHFLFDTRNTRANTTVQAVPYGPPLDPFWGRPRLGYWGGWGGWGFPYEAMQQRLAQGILEVMVDDDDAHRRSAGGGCGLGWRRHVAGKASQYVARRQVKLVAFGGALKYGGATWHIACPRAG